MKPRYHISHAALGAALCAVLSLAASVSAKEAVSIQESATASVSDAAVSEINGKIDGHYGRVNDTYTRGAAGSLSLPVGQRFGVQLDGLYSHANEDDFYGLGGHFFARKPEQGLIGVVASGVVSGDVESYLAAVEGEYYFDKVTLGAVVGYNHFQTDVPFPTYNTALRDEKNFAYAHIYAAIYPVDDLMVRLNYRNQLERNAYGVLIEYQLPVRGLSVYADLALGDNNFRQIIGGMRYYFGSNKTLKARHRQDDPANILPDLQTGGVAASSETAEPVVTEPFKKPK